MGHSLRHPDDTQSARWVRRLSVLFLVGQGIGGLAWWVMLFGWPATRQWFLPASAPDAALLAFAASDLLFYVAAALLAALGLWLGRGWTRPVLLVHCGAVVYAGSYCVSLWGLEPSTWLPAAMMTPSLLIVPLITWHFCLCGTSPP